MLAYAANAPRTAERRSSPNAMLAIIAVHVALLAAVMSARGDLSRHRPEPPIVVDTIPLPKPPPPEAQAARPSEPQPGPTAVKPIFEPPVPLPGPSFPDQSFNANPEPFPAPGPATVPQPNQNPPRAVVRSGPQLLTPASELKPPYPESKLVAEQEAVLTLRLTIDERGRVAAVDPVGAADGVFLETARKYLIAHWRYKPAMEDGRAVGSAITIMLHFQLDG